jgi:hypothetical protein
MIAGEQLTLIWARGVPKGGKWRKKRDIDIFRVKTEKNPVTA